MDRSARALAWARRLEAWAAARQWRGSDPYEGLNASRLVGPLRGWPLSRRLVIQTVKRSPVDLRPILGIRPAANPAGVAWVASAYALNGMLEREQAGHRLRAALAVLEQLRCPGFSEPCWGYGFDFQSRVLFYGREEPNTVATAFAGMALLDAYDALGEASLLERARDVGRFFLRHVPLTADGDGGYFGYAPGDRSPVHNSSMLVAALLARICGAGTGGEGFRSAAEAALAYTIARQRPDGSWPYGERPNLGWVDNFHTGYVLDALDACATAGVAAGAARDAWDRGLRFYRRELFRRDGAPRYYSGSTYPLDAQCVAQAMQTLSIASRHEPSCRADAWRVFEFARRRMLDRDGLPVFQRRRLYTVRIPHMRWVIAPTLLALVRLMAAESQRPRPAESSGTAWADGTEVRPRRSLPVGDRAG
ncbi:MAG: hypothetical protein ACRDM7_18780 [Thermoleophilaceae bacterium]